jgi:hypothetical protein
MRRSLVVAAGCTALVSCLGGGNTQAQPPPLYPRQLPVALEPVPLENLQLPRTPLLQTILLPPQLARASQTDEFVQSQALLDVFWVVSTAGSMDIELNLLASALPSFTTLLTDAKVTWQIGVTSSDLSTYELPGDGGLHVGQGGQLHGPSSLGPLPLITPGDPNYVSDFGDALTWQIQRGSASSQTSIFASMKLALDAAAPGGANQGLRRPGAALAVIAAANTDDESFGEAGYFARYLQGLAGKGNEQLVTFSALGGPADAGCTPPGEDKIFGAHVEPTPRLHELTDDTGGVFESICDEAGFNGSLEQIALNLKTLRRYFPLSAPPNPETLSVTIDGQPVAQDPQAGWQYLASVNAVAFLGSTVPDPGASVVITYAVSQ